VCLLHCSVALQVSFFHMAQNVFLNNSSSVHRFCDSEKKQFSEKQEVEKCQGGEKLYVQHSFQT
jgi:hypothetical protein